MFKRKKAQHHPEKNEKVLDDIQAIQEFMEDIHTDEEVIRTEAKKLEELEKEFHVASPKLIETNLKTQAKAIETLLDRYEFFQTDVDINGLRLKKIATEFLRRAEKAGLKDFVKQKKKDMTWKMQW